MNISYDSKSGFVYVSRVDQIVNVAETRQLAPGVMGDYDSEGRLLGVEIWGSAGNLKMVTR